MRARPVQSLILLALRAYQAFLSPVFAGACRFYPSCSAYAVEAVERHGVRQGLWLAVKRLLRCRPFQVGPASGGAGGYDPVPDRSIGLEPRIPQGGIGRKSETPLTPGGSELRLHPGS